MFFSVKEMAELSHTTVKTLHHYHKIGLLLPAKITEAGYRLYSRKELERLQEILFYRELDFSLLKIKQLLDQKSNRKKVLVEQKQLLQTRRNRMDQLLDTITKSINSEERGEKMGKQDLFKGFTSDEEWREALKEQDEYLQAEYEYPMLSEQKEIKVDDLNQKAAEAVYFTNKMIESLRAGVKFDDKHLLETIEEHVTYLKAQNMLENDTQFLEQTKFFLEDDFHRTMLESQHTGLAYYLYVSAEAYVQHNAHEKR
jgi:DNA-binding transcriptional MerR regulator